MQSQAQQTFSATTESDVTRALTREFAAHLDDSIESDVIIAGGGPSGLMCGKVLAQNGIKVLIVERNNYLGGGFWIGGFLMNKAVLRPPSDALLDDLGVPYTTPARGICVADAPHACAKLIAAACDAGVKIQNMTSVEDVVVRDDNRVAGLVINWTPVQALPRQIACVDPVAIEAKIVVDATGHDAAVVSMLAQRGLAEVKGCGPMWVERSEDDVVRHTGLVHPGIVAVGMSVSAVFGLPRMGPSFGAMLVSGVGGAEIILDLLKSGDVAAAARAAAG